MMVAEYGCDPANIHAAIGPNIALCCFETDEDVPNALREALGEEVVDMMFYFLEGYGRQPECATLEEAFNLFWEAANRLHW